MPKNYEDPQIMRDYKNRPIIIKDSSVQDQMIQKASLATVTSKFGPRTHPITKEKSTHTGVDLVGAGVIITKQNPKSIEVTYDEINGLRIKMIMPIGIVYIAHLMTVILRYSTNGFVVGIMGSSGRSTGLHVHAEYWVDGRNESQLLEDASFRDSIFASL